MPATETPAETLPQKMNISLQIGGFFFALANVICVAIIVLAWLSVKHEPKTLEVKGSAKKAITSDTITWGTAITARDADLPKAYEKLKADADKVAAFIKAAGVPEKEVTFYSINTQKIFAKQMIPTTTQPAGAAAAPTALSGTVISPGGNGAPMVIQTDRVEEYVLTQAVTIESHSMDKVPAISRNITNLIKDGVEIESGAPRYTYSKLSELKIDMLAEATKDATNRATQIVTNANGKLGRLVEAKMGVMQINPKGETGVSDTGNNDVTALEKEILAVVTVKFELR